MTDFVPSAEQLAVLDHPVTPLRIAAGAGTGKTTTLGPPNRPAHRQRVRTRRAARRHVHEQGGRRARRAHPRHPRRHRRSLAEKSTFTPTTGLPPRSFKNTGRSSGSNDEPGSSPPPSAASCFTTRWTEAPTPSSTSPTSASSTGRPNSPPTSATTCAPFGSWPTWHPPTPTLVWAARTRSARYRGALRRREGPTRGGRLRRPDRQGHEIVTRHPDVADRIRQRYRAVFLDEYQDTNPAQRELLRAIFARWLPGDRSG